MACPSAPPPVSACTPCSEAQERLQNRLRPDPQPGGLCSHLRAEKPVDGQHHVASQRQRQDDGPSAPTSLPKPHFPATTPAPPTWGLGSEQASHSLTPVFHPSPLLPPGCPLPRPLALPPLPCCQPDVTCSSSKSCFKEVGGGRSGRRGHQ